MIPDQLRASIERRLGTDRTPVRIIDAAGVGGGCISPAVRLETTAGCYFLKWREAGSPPGLFEAEATSLRVLGEAGAVRVPLVQGVDRDWLILEWLEPGRAVASTWTHLGGRLADLHRVTGRAPGWTEDNFIGSLPQSNGSLADWPAFWAERRLDPQWEEAARAGAFDAADRRAFERLSRRLDEVLGACQQEGTSLLHGDLWHGNVHVMRDGEAALIDPSSCFGHREVDLAMADLFGGFGAGFHDAYRNAWPLLPGHEDRFAIYQLYYLLVHVNLFGSAYVARTRSILRRFGG